MVAGSWQLAALENELFERRSHHLRRSQGLEMVQPFWSTSHLIGFYVDQSGDWVLWFSTIHVIIIGRPIT